MAYLNLDLDYFEHPKVKRLVGLLGKGAEVLSLRLWCYCGKYHKEDGRLAGYSTQEIESIAGWWGKQGEMIDAMVKVHVIDVVDGVFVMHDWEEHEGHLPALSVRAKTAAQARWSRLRGDNGIPKSEKKEGSAPQSDATSIAPSNAKPMLEQCSLPSMPSKPNQQTAVASSEGLPVLVQQPADSEKAPLPPDVVIPADQFEKKDGSTLKAYLYHVWGREANKVSWDIQTKMIDLARRFGWPAVYRAIDEAATHGAMNFAYTESIVDPEKAAERKARKEAAAKVDEAKKRAQKKLPPESGVVEFKCDADGCDEHQIFPIVELLPHKGEKFKCKKCGAMHEVNSLIPEKHLQTSAC